MSQEVTTRPQAQAELIAFVKDNVMPGASDAELASFLSVAKATGLDPMRRQVFAVSRWDDKLKRERWTTQASIDGFRAVAEATGRYEGQLGPFWCGEDGQWLDVWLKKAPPSASKVGVIRAGFKEPLYRVALFSEYAQRKKDGTLTKFWIEKPALMLAKCAEALALRSAFPQSLSGVYSDDEIPKEVEVQSEVTPIAAATSPQRRIQQPYTLPFTPENEERVYAQEDADNAARQTQMPKSTALPKPVATQGAPDTSPALKSLIDRAKQGGPDAIAEAAKPAVELKWDGPLPSCMAAKVPFGKQKGTALVDLSMPEALAMADWIKAQAAKGKIPPTWVEFYFAVMDYEQSSQPLQETPQFGDEQQTSLAGVIR